MIEVGLLKKLIKTARDKNKAIHLRLAPVDRIIIEPDDNVDFTHDKKYLIINEDEIIDLKYIVTAKINMTRQEILDEIKKSNGGIMSV